MVRYLSKGVEYAYTGLGVGFGIAGANLLSAVVVPRIPFGTSPVGRVALNAIFKLGTGIVLAHYLAPRARGAKAFVQFMGYGALGSAFSDVVFSLISRVAPVPSAYGSMALRARPDFPGTPGLWRTLRPQAHVTPARPSWGNGPMTTMGTSVGPSFGKAPLRSANAVQTRPSFVRVSVPGR